ncbi:CU044_5270 family protein [Streptomyces sp. NPDC088812]|uniref:CU044_5270 family protein n=1 Tax=Streptomyces sp. NPDC088812 TaxID=3365905 RepID=UPI0037FE3254
MPEQDLPPGRHRLLKEHLMTEIRMAEQTPATEADDRGRRPWRRPSLVAAAVAAVAAVTFTVVPASDGRTGSRPATTAAVLLEDLALAAEHEEARDEVRDDQYTYVETKVAWTGARKGGPTTTVPLHRHETWIAVDGKRKSLTRDAVEGERELPGEPQPGDHLADWSSSYNHLKTLPTDPDAMYDWLRRMSQQGFMTAAVGSTWYPVEEPEQAMLLAAGTVLEDTLLPPAQSAALYRAVARIPGVTVDEDAVDVLGRHAVAIARQGRKIPARVEWFFDSETHEFLGRRSVATEDSGGLKKGTVTYDSAVVRRAVVDKAGERP